MRLSNHPVCKRSATRIQNRPTLRGISPQTTAAITIVFFALTSGAFADVGDTVEQAKERFGPPSGEMKSGSRTILIYRTPLGKVTETYNAQGTCVESNAGQLPPPRIVTTSRPKPANKPLPKTATTPAPASQEHLRYISPEERAARPDMQPLSATASTKSQESTPREKIIPPVLIAIALASVAGGIFSWLRRKTEPAENSASAVNEIKALCDFEQRRHDRKPMQQSQQNPDSKYYKDYPAA